MATHGLKGDWNQLRGQVKQKWGRLTNDDLEMVEGKHDELVGRLQVKYQYTKDRAEREVNQFMDQLDAGGVSAVASNVVHTVDETVTRYPYATIGLALLLGLVVGLFVIPVGRK